MRFDFTVHADSTAELGEALATIQNAFPANLFEQPMRGFAVNVTPSFPSAYPSVGSIGTDPALSGAVAEALAAQPEGLTANAPAKTPRASRAKAAAPAAEQEPAPPAPPEDEDDDPLGMSPTPQPPGKAAKLTPAEGKARALEILRDCYAAPGGAAAVKVLQKEFGGVKFADVPDDKGLELLAKAEAMKAKLP